MSCKFNVIINVTATYLFGYVLKYLVPCVASMRATSMPFSLSNIIYHYEKMSMQYTDIFKL